MTHPYQLSAQLRAGVLFQRLAKLLECHLEDTKASFSGFVKVYATLTNVDSMRVTKRLDANLDSICLDAIQSSAGNILMVGLFNWESCVSISVPLLHATVRIYTK